MTYRSTTGSRNKAIRVAAATGVALCLAVGVPTATATATPDRGPHKSTPGGTNNDNHVRHGAEPDRSPHKFAPGHVSSAPNAQTNRGHADFRQSPQSHAPSATTSAHTPGASSSRPSTPATPPARSVAPSAPAQSDSSVRPTTPQTAPETTDPTDLPRTPNYSIPVKDQNGNEWTPTTNPTTGDTTWQTQTPDGTSYTAGPHYDRHSVDPDGLTQVVTRDKDGTMNQVAVVDPRTKSGTGKILIDNEWRDTTFDGDYHTATVAGRWSPGKGPYDSKADITVNADGGYTVDTTVKGNQRSASPGTTAYRDIVTEAPDRTVTKVEVVDVRTGQRREVPIDPEFGEGLHDVADKVLDIGDYPAKKAVDQLKGITGVFSDTMAPQPVPKPNKPIFVPPSRGGHN